MAHKGARSNGTPTAKHPSLLSSICEGRSFDTVFRALARSVVESSAADCAFELPEPPSNQTIDPATINLVLRGSGGVAPVQVRQVASARDCGTTSSFYIDGHIQLCPSICAAIKRDQAPQVDILYGCSVIAI